MSQERSVKLSKAQKEVIQKLRNGNVILSISGINARCFWRDTHKNISWATVFALEKKGLISRAQVDGFVTLTELGITLN